MNIPAVPIAAFTSDGVAQSAPALLYSVVVTASSAGGGAVIYNNASAASGTILATVKAAAANETVQVSFNPPVPASLGLFVDLTNAVVYVQSLTI